MKLDDLLKAIIQEPALDKVFAERAKKLAESATWEYSRGLESYIARLFGNRYLIIFVYFDVKRFIFEVRFHRDEIGFFTDKKGKKRERYQTIEQNVEISLNLEAVDFSKCIKHTTTTVMAAQ